MDSHRPKRIEKARQRVAPCLVDYDAARRDFSWEKARASLAGLPGGGLNIAYEAVDKHAAGLLKNHLAIRWLGKSGQADLTYAELARETNRFANLLRRLGLQKGSRVFLLSGRIPELYITVLGALKNGSVVCPMFSAFGPEPVRARMSIGEAELLVTTEALYAKKVAPVRAELPALKHVLLVREHGAAGALPEGTQDFRALLAAADAQFQAEPTQPADAALLHFTSGTTGKPKGALHVHDAVVEHALTGRLALDFHPEDIYWCTADPGWVTGMSYGIISPLVNGITSIVDESDFDAQRWYQILKEQKVSVWYTAPTAIRMMMKAGAELAKSHRFDALRFIASVGEPLNPEAVFWGLDAFGLPIHDNWWQTETGGIMLANFAAMDIKPGSMGKPLPGIEVKLGRRSATGAVEWITEPGEQGELAIRANWPSMFRTYVHEEERYRKCFAEGFYFSGDLATFDAEGYFWFVGRADDVIKSAGHLIGPFEVESALMEHPAVAEAGVIGKPDAVAGEIVKAFVSLKQGFAPTPELRRELIGFARKRLGPAIAPKEIDYVANLPKTRSGKIMRRLLKSRELGLPEGDTSTLEASP